MGNLGLNWEWLDGKRCTISRHCNWLDGLMRFWEGRQQSWGASGRWFKSSRPDHLALTYLARIILAAVWYPTPTSRPRRLLSAECEGGRNRPLPGPGTKPPSERP